MLSQEVCESPVNDLLENAISKPNTKTKHCWGCERAGSYLGLFCGVCVSVCVCESVYMYVSKVTAALIFYISRSLSTQIGVTVALLTTIAGVISVNQTWGQEWDVIPISLQVSRLKHWKAPKLLLMA